MTVTESFLEDDDALSNLDGDRELLATIRGVFLDTIEEALSPISVEGLRDNPDEFLRAVHSLKSSAGSIGAVKLSNLARQLESMLREGKRDLVEPLVPSLIACFNSTVEEIRSR